MTSAPTMVFSHPTAGEDAAHAKDRRHADEAARDVTFSAPATTVNPAGVSSRPVGQAGPE
jgi:hypothetical protein